MRILQSRGLQYGFDTVRCSGRERFCNSRSNLVGRVGMSRIEHYQRKTGTLTCVDKESIPVLPVLLLMRFIVEFYGAKHRQIVRLAKNEVKMLAVDLVQGRRSRPVVQAVFWRQNIAHPDFPEYPEILAGHKIKHTQERAFGWSEKGCLPLEWQCPSVITRLLLLGNSNDDEKNKKHGDRNPEHGNPCVCAMTKSHQGTPRVMSEQGISARKRARQTDSGYAAQPDVVSGGATISFAMCKSKDRFTQAFTLAASVEPFAVSG